MIDDKEIQRWIARLECEESSWSNYEKLAVLYALQKREEPNQVITAPAVAAYSDTESNGADLVGDYGDSDFLRAVSGSDPARAWAIMDELMDSLRVVNERVYNSVMRKLS